MTRGRQRVNDDAGSAIVEFIVVGVLVLVPMVYLVQCATVVHAAALASSQAVREAGRAFSTAVDERSARAMAAVAARLAFADQGMRLPPGALHLTCPEVPCLTPGSVVDATIDWEVPLPWLPAQWSGADRLSVPMSARQRVPLDDFRGDPGAAP